MFLRKIRIKNIVFSCLLLFTNMSIAEGKNKEDIINYLKELENFSVSFVQNGHSNLQEGKIYVGSKRIRVEYEEPSKILIILAEKKAMYYNYDLDEDEFFNPEDTPAWFFFEIFKNPNFFSNSEIVSLDNNIKVISKGNYDGNEYNLEIHFEINPIVLRKIDLKFNEDNLILSIFNHKFEETFNKNFFKLINPKLFN